MAAQDIMYGLVHCFEFIVIFNLVFPLALYLLWKFSKKDIAQATISNENSRDYAVIVTVYEQTLFIPDVVQSLLNLDYDKFLIYIVADNCQPDENLTFHDPRVSVLYPPTVLSNNVKSHFFAINNFSRPHDVLLIIDSDNLAHPSLIHELNRSFDKGFKAVQGVRMAKNMDTTIAALDAARDIYYHFYDGKLLFGVGSSATLSGSGMAFDVPLYRQSLEHVPVNGAGFDKVLQAMILSEDNRIAFSENAIVYDQKTAGSNQLVKQRSRWINTWFKFFKYGFSLICKGIRNFSLNQFLFGIVLLRPPLFMFLLLCIVLIFVNLFINAYISVALTVSLCLFIIGFIIALRSGKTDEKVYKALRFIPMFIFYQLISLGRSLIPDQKNIATKHDQKK